MADTGEDREIKRRVEAHQAEVVRESKELVAKFKERRSTEDGKPKSAVSNSKKRRRH